MADPFQFSYTLNKIIYLVMFPVTNNSYKLFSLFYPFSTLFDVLQKCHMIIHLLHYKLYVCPSYVYVSCTAIQIIISLLVQVFYTMVDICGADPDPMQQELARLRNGCWVSDYVSCTAIQIIISLLTITSLLYYA